MAKAKSNHYVNNADFLEAIREYRLKVQESKDTGADKPQVSNYIGQCILKIATHLSYKPNFINYSYREEMISDGIENCLTYVDNFDPAKSSNPFAYFTQIIYFAFLRRIQKEKKQTLIKGRLIMEMPFEAFELQEHDNGEYASSYIEFIQNNRVYDDIIDSDNKKRAAAKTKRANRATVDDIIEPSDVEGGV